jgi:hypothetical protein
MAGLIWFVQVVHYPLMARVGVAEAPAFAAEHQRRTGWVVGPLMLVEAATAALLVIAPPDGVPRAAAVAGLALVAVIWASTALLQVPRHREMLLGFDPAGHRRLVRGNWVRTAAWTARAALVTGMLAAAAG